MGLSFTKRIELVTIEEAAGPEAHGSVEVLFSKVWADIKTMKGSEVQTLGLSGHELSSRFIIRYMEGITPDMQIRYKGNLYDIHSIVNDDEQNRTITMIGKAVL